MQRPWIFRKPQGLQICSYVTLHRRKICESAWCFHDIWISKSRSSLSNPSENLSKNLSKSDEIVKSMGSHRKLDKFESSCSYPKLPTSDSTFLGSVAVEVFLTAKGKILIFFRQIQESVKYNFPPCKPPSVSVSSKPECLTKICVLPKEEKTQSGTQAKPICEFKRTSSLSPQETAGTCTSSLCAVRGTGRKSSKVLRNLG